MRRRILIGGIAIVLVLLAGSISYAAYFSSHVNPPHKAPGIATSCGTVVPTTGLRSFHIVPAQTTASYKVHENLILRNLPSTDAIGKTKSVQGNFSIRSGTAPLVAGMQVTVDLTTLQTNEPQRDSHVQQDYLQTDTYPNATFISTCVQHLPATYTDGQPLSFQITGNLTLHGKTNKETFDVQGKLVGNTITGNATTTIFMTDFGIQPPNLATIAIAENKVVLTIDFTAIQG